jgi:hypothetical protein
LKIDQKQKSPLLSFNPFAAPRRSLAIFHFQPAINVHTVALPPHGCIFVSDPLSGCRGPFTHQNITEAAMKTILTTFIFLAGVIFSSGSFAIDPGTASGTLKVDGEAVTLSKCHKINITF